MSRRAWVPNRNYNIHSSSYGKNYDECVCQVGNQNKASWPSIDVCVGSLGSYILVLLYTHKIHQQASRQWETFKFVRNEEAQTDRSRMQASENLIMLCPALFNPATCWVNLSPRPAGVSPCAPFNMFYLFHNRCQLNVRCVYTSDILKRWHNAHEPQFYNDTSN